MPQYRIIVDLSDYQLHLLDGTSWYVRSRLPSAKWLHRRRQAITPS